jgi:uncharacterized protein (TIGR02996 family)
MSKPHPEETALLKAIVSRPDDDLPRLVYADWLDEHGRAERARFIRLQIADEQPQTGIDRKEIRSDMAGLFDEHGRVWFRELPKWARRWYEELGWAVPVFRRGFIDDLNVYLSPFLTYGERLLDRTPITSLSVYQVKRLFPQLARCRWLGRVPSLNLCYEPFGEKGAEALAANRDLRGVRHLDLSGCQLGDPGVRALAEARSLGGLRTLSLRNNDLTLAAVKALRLTPISRSLRHLDLSENPRLRGHADRIRDWLGGRVTVDRLT